MKKKVIAAIGFYGLVLSQSASGMLNVQNMPDSPWGGRPPVSLLDVMRRMHVKLPFTTPAMMGGVPPDSGHDCMGYTAPPIYNGRHLSVQIKPAGVGNPLMPGGKARWLSADDAELLNSLADMKADMLDEQLRNMPTELSGWCRLQCRMIRQYGHLIVEPEYEAPGAVNGPATIIGSMGHAGSCLSAIGGNSLPCSFNPLKTDLRPLSTPGRVLPNSGNNRMQNAGRLSYARHWAVQERRSHIERELLMRAGVPSGLPKFVPITVPEENTAFPVHNGLCGLGRLILKLLELVRNSADTTRLILGVTGEVASLREHIYFRIMRFNFLAKTDPEDLIGAAIQKVFGSLHCGHNSFNIRLNSIRLRLASTKLMDVYMRLYRLDRNTFAESLDWASVADRCVGPESAKDFACPSLGRVRKIPGLVLPGSLWSLAEYARIPDLPPDLASQITFDAILAADRVDIIPQLEQLAQNLRIPFPKAWKAAGDILKRRDDQRRKRLEQQRKLEA